jgi:hypothetical protein
VLDASLGTDQRHVIGRSVEVALHPRVEIRLHLGATDARGAARISARAARDPTQMLSVRYGNPDLDRSIGIGIGLPVEDGGSRVVTVHRPVQAGRLTELTRPALVCTRS